MINLKALDHVAFAVPDLAEQVARFQAMGMQVQQHVATYALMVDPASGFKIELKKPSLCFHGCKSVKRAMTKSLPLN